jgi:hypothetical protein
MGIENSVKTTCAKKTLCVCKHLEARGLGVGGLLGWVCMCESRASILCVILGCSREPPLTI